MPILVFSPLEYSTEKQSKNKIMNPPQSVQFTWKCLIGAYNSYLRGMAGGACVAIALNGSMFLALQFTRS